MTYTIAVRTGEVHIDHERCAACASHACIAACARYGVGILALVDGRPQLNVPPDEAQRRDNECLACEEACRLRGQAAITIVLPIAGLEEHEERHGHPAG